MKMDHLKIILFFIILLTFGFQCDEDIKPVYEFELPYIVSPVKKEYHVNDTIRISVIIKDRSLKDLKSKNLVEIKCTDIPVWFSVGVREPNYNLLSSNNVFETIVDSLNFPYSEIENNGQYSKFRARVNDSIFYKEEIVIMKLILKKTGIFMMDPNDYDNIFISKTDSCSTTHQFYDEGILNHIFDVADSNPELLEESPLPSNVYISGDHVPWQTAEKRIFWFKVIE